MTKTTLLSAALFAASTFSVTAEIRAEHDFINSLSDEQILTLSKSLNEKARKNTDAIRKFRDSKKYGILKENMPYLLAELQKYADTHLKEFTFNARNGVDRTIFGIDFEQDGVEEYLITGGTGNQTFYALATLDGEKTRVFSMNFTGQDRGRFNPKVGYLPTDGVADAKVHGSYTKRDMIYLKEEGVVIDPANLATRIA